MDVLEFVIPETLLAASLGSWTCHKPPSAASVISTAEVAAGASSRTAPSALVLHFALLLLFPDTFASLSLRLMPPLLDGGCAAKPELGRLDARWVEEP